MNTWQTLEEGAAMLPEDIRIGARRGTGASRIEDFGAWITCEAWNWR
jgi:hypothetical protein